MNETQNEYSESQKLINKALKYTNGDLQKAQEMVAGIYKDIVVVKGRFKNDIVGGFCVFFNIVNNYIANTYIILTDYQDLYNKFNIFEKWKQYYRDLNDFVVEHEDQIKDTYDFSIFFSNSLNDETTYNFLKSMDLDKLTEKFKIILNNYFETQVYCQIELENASSLELEESNIPMEIPSTDTEVEEVQTEDEIRMKEIENQFEFIIPGSVIVSPVKGKYIRDIKVGDKISVMLSGNDPLTQKIAKMYNATTNEGEFLPIKARIKEKLPLSTGGYAIYALVAKNVAVKIIEEEENVKIEIENIAKNTQNESNDNKLMYYIVMLIFLIIMVILIVSSLI